MPPRLRLLLASVSLLFFATHIGALPRTLEDIDSINLALGVERFDVSVHRPHPPGYPVYVALAKASTGAVGVVAPSWDRDRRAASGLALLGLVAGTVAVFVLAELWLALGFAPLLACLAAILGVASPLFWFTAARPLTDVPGLVVAVAIQAALLRGLHAYQATASAMPGSWWWGAFAAGLAIGFRSQVLWLTAPLLAWCLGQLVRRRAWVAALQLLGVAALGTLAWLVPLIWVTGGPARYLDAVLYQGTQDLSGIDLLSTRWSGRLLRQALDYTFVQPWQHVALASLVLALSLLGAARLAQRDRRALAGLALGFGPYLGFHLAFHETVTIRYALPLMVLVAGLAAYALAILGPRVLAAGAGVLAVVSIVLVQPPLQAYAREGAPVFRAFQDMHRERTSRGIEPVLRMHHQVWWGILRTIEWYRSAWDLGSPKFPGDREWLEVVDYWKSGGTSPVWFLSELSRSDLTQFDARARQRAGYELSAGVRTLIGGARLDSLAWTTINRPGWMVGRGWALTPEVTGMTGQDNAWPHLRPADAWLLRRPGPVRMLIGGRRLFGSAPAEIAIDLDGQPMARIPVPGDRLWFVHWIDLPAGITSGQGPYAHVTVGVTSTDSTQPAPQLSLEQFDAASPDQIMFAFESDWQEAEASPARRRAWRWTSAQSTLDIRGPERDLTLTLAGESPLIYFDRAPTVVVRAGAQELRRFRPAGDFTEQIQIPAAALAAAGGRVTIDTDLTFVPFERRESADKRRLGLRLYQIEVR